MVIYQTIEKFSPSIDDNNLFPLLCDLCPFVLLVRTFAI